ncbi:hypothetical protein [Amycolatopsis taiwanensis]|uniref:hypothetical protein n=1 Tax=Amycolatopsis taiwanensis TaxID=342230 RepID=UPI0025535EDC|nr:hypothetical protein [Amycolatopsis taiwanensis]
MGVEGGVDAFGELRAVVPADAEEQPPVNGMLRIDRAASQVRTRFGRRLGGVREDLAGEFLVDPVARTHGRMPEPEGGDGELRRNERAAARAVEPGSVALDVAYHVRIGDSGQELMDDDPLVVPGRSLTDHLDRRFNGEHPSIVWLVGALCSSHAFLPR